MRMFGITSVGFCCRLCRDRRPRARPICRPCRPIAMSACTMQPTAAAPDRSSSTTTSPAFTCAPIGSRRGVTAITSPPPASSRWSAATRISPRAERAADPAETFHPHMDDVVRLRRREPARALPRLRTAAGAADGAAAEMTTVIRSTAFAALVAVGCCLPHRRRRNTRRRSRPLSVRRRSPASPTPSRSRPAPM